jgi:hypothetical protein
MQFSGTKLKLNKPKESEQIASLPGMPEGYNHPTKFEFGKTSKGDCGQTFENLTPRFLKISKPL